MKDFKQTIEWYHNELTKWIITSEVLAVILGSILIGVGLRWF